MKKKKGRSNVLKLVGRQFLSNIPDIYYYPRKTACCEGVKMQTQATIQSFSGIHQGGGKMKPHPSNMEICIDKEIQFFTGL